MKLYFVKNNQFIGEIEVDETKTPIQIWCDSYTDYEYNQESLNPSINATYMFQKWVYIEKDFNPTYYDVNLNKVDYDLIKSIKNNTHTDFETDEHGNYYLYKSQEHVQDLVIYNIYIASWNKAKCIIPNELYVEPEKNTGTINLYDIYGNVESTFFHINGKINGKEVNYYGGNGRKQITNYVDGIRQGETIKYGRNDNIVEKGYYLNDKLEGDKIYYRANSDISMIEIYHSGKVFKITKFYDNETIEVENEYNDDGELSSHKSFYDNGTKFMEITITDNHDVYELTHYFKNGQIAWKAKHELAYHNNYNTGYDRKVSRENVKEIFNEDGLPISLNEFDKLYDKKQFKTNNIYDLFLKGHSNHTPILSSFMMIFTFIKY